MPGRYRFSMPSSRDSTDPWFRLGSIDVTTTLFVSFTSVASFFLYALSPQALTWFYLLPDKVLEGQVWRLFTYPMANRPAVFTVIAIAIYWYLGTQVESRLGRVKYLWLTILTVFIPALIATALDVQVAEIRSLEIAIFVVFVCENPKMPFFFAYHRAVSALQAARDASK